VFGDLPACEALFRHETPRAMTTVPVLTAGRAALVAANQSLGLALADDEIDYLVKNSRPSDAIRTTYELMMFAQANSSTAAQDFQRHLGNRRTRSATARCSR